MEGRGWGAGRSGFCRLALLTPGLRRGSIVADAQTVLAKGGHPLRSSTTNHSFELLADAARLLSQLPQPCLDLLLIRNVFHGLVIGLDTDPFIPPYVNSEEHHLCHP